ncbi:MAG TPA: ABC transporter ATP-binding protein [Candidatus Hydrogenedentes bacterium]|nr:ABC transporter ATP-binding protein [Candidatus Hydrogenedentota bacterium]
MNTSAPLLELSGVVKEYPALPTPLRVLRGVDFSLGAGECAAILGPSGCGKSTLLNVMGTLDLPDAGTVKICGHDVAGMNASALARLRNHELGFVFQLHHLLPQCTALENVLIPALVHENRAAAKDEASRLLERVGLLDRRDHRPGELSGGEQQRGAVARALINGPSLLLADEPTGALNEEAAAELAELLLELQRERNMAIVIVTHASDLAERFAPIYEMHGGRLKRRE